MRLFGIGLALSTALACSGCATLLNSGPSEVDLVVLDAPAGLTITAHNQQSREARTFTGQRRVALPLQRGATYEVTVSAPGHRPSVYQVDRALNPWLLADLALLAGGGTFCVVGYQSPSITGVSIALLGLLGGTAGTAMLATDLATGACWRHAPERIEAELKALP